MKLTVLLIFIVQVYASKPFWYPVNDFFNDIANKTQKFNKIVADQNTRFMENVTNGTRKLRDMFEKMPESVKDSFSNKENSEEEDKMANKEAELSTPGIVAANGYPCESHTVVTSDGYILTIHRIPKSPFAVESNASRAVFLQHGLFASSADWVFAGRKRSLAYQLSDAGFDVWMGNVRGNRYSREHVTLKTDTERYWNFSWHEIATRDLPAVIDYIHEMKGPGTNLTYIGHSMGTTVLFALLSSNPEYNKKLHAGIALAPVVFAKDVRGPARELARYSDNFEHVATLIGKKEFFPRQTGTGWLGSSSCHSQLQYQSCLNFIFSLCGFDEEQFDRSMLPVFLAHIGSGTSVKTVVHYSQEITSDGRFQMFDYGSIDNNKEYGCSTPPAYNLDNITVPIALFSAKNDRFSSEVDVKKLYDTLKSKKELYTIQLEKFNHLDFLLANDVKTLVYEKLFNILIDWDC